MRIQKSEPVQLVAKTHSYFPASFRWRGRRFDVVAVEKDVYKRQGECAGSARQSRPGG